MISFRDRQRIEDRVEVGHQSLQLIGRETSILIGMGRIGFEITYRRPSSLRSGADRSSVPIRDHVMIVRLIAAALPLLVAARRIMNV